MIQMKRLFHHVNFKVSWSARRLKISIREIIIIEGNTLSFLFFGLTMRYPKRTHVQHERCL